MQAHPILAKAAKVTPGIYMPHTQNKNILEKNLGYIGVNDQYKDPAFRSKISSRFKGKQFITNPPKNSSGDVGYFDKLIHKGGVYVDRTKYIDTQPIDKRSMGFCSRDASRRDEFTTNIKTEQYREQLKCELTVANRLTKAAPKQAWAANKGKKTFPAGLKETKHLFDIGRKNETAFDPKSACDTFYNALQCKSRNRGERRTGGAYISSQEVGDGIAALDHGAWKPKHGLRHATKEFYDRSHVGQSALR
jgi:hypothetical protein